VSEQNMHSPVDVDTWEGCPMARRRQFREAG
jgi:hypothetical protein